MQVWRRDAGVCALCGSDTTELVEELRDIFAMLKEQHRAPCGAARKAFEKVLAEHRVTLHDWGHRKLRYGLWDMDHRQPVDEGGGECGLDNLQTACLRCHRNKTAEQARRKADNATGQLPLFEDEYSF